MSVIIGEDKIKSIYVGEQKIVKAYVGANLVFSAKNRQDCLTDIRN